MKRWLSRILKAFGALVLVVGALVLFNYLRHIVFWAPTEAVEFVSGDGTVLRGVLLKPSDDGVHPAVVMLHGSGPESMDGPSYHILANAIVRSGVAVLLYDKRGVGVSGGDFDSALYSDFIADGIAAVRHLASRDDVDRNNIGLHANSESGWFSPEIAYTTGQVAYIFNRVGPPFSVRETIIWEVRNDLLAAGVPETYLPELLELTERRWQYYIDAANDPSLAEGAVRDAINADLERVTTEIPGAESEVPEALAAYDQALYEGAAEELSYDQRPFLEALNIPMVFTFGAEDINVPTVRAVAYLEEFRDSTGKDIRIYVYDDVGHPLANVTGILNGGYVPAFMDLLYEFYGARVTSATQPPAPR